MKNSELITDALREIGVIDAYTEPSSEAAASALRKLNSLMSSLKAETIELGYFSQTNASEDLPLSEDDALLIMPIFAMALTINYPSAQIPQTLPAWAASNHSRLLLNAVLGNAQEASLTNMPLGSWRGWW